MSTHAASPGRPGEPREILAVTVHRQLFGLPVASVREVLGPREIIRIPLAPPEVSGALNLRGRIITALDLRRCLGLPKRPEGQAGVNVVVDRDGELYGLTVDSVGDVLRVPGAAVEPNPPTLDPLWHRVSDGIYPLENRLLIVLDIDRLLTFNQADAA